MEKIVLKVKEFVNETSKAFTLKFENIEGVSYLPGQYFTLIFTIEGKEHRRSYSLSSAPDIDSNPAVTIKRVEGGLISNYIADNIKVGDEIKALSPSGRFALDVQKQKNILLVGGGSGVTPLLSMIKTSLTKTTDSNVSLIYVNASKEDTIFLNEIESLSTKFSNRFKVSFYFDNEPKIKQKTGLKKLFSKKAPSVSFINDSILKEMISELAVPMRGLDGVFICGPNGLMDIAKSTVSTLGVGKDYIFQEHFVATTSNDTTDAKKEDSFSGKSKVTFILNGDEHVIEIDNKKSVLHAALDAGIEAPFSCQAGICTACMGRCTSGNVKMTNSDSLTPKEIEEGLVLTCVSHVNSSEVVINYDEI